MADNDPTTPELLAAWDAFDWYGYPDDEEAADALLKLADRMAEALRAGVSPPAEDDQRG